MIALILSTLAIFNGLLANSAILAATDFTVTDPCFDIEEMLRNVTSSDGRPVCQCLPESMGTTGKGPSSSDKKSDQGDGIWVGCTRQKMPAVFRALNALDEATPVSHLWIWASLINIMPNEMFARIRPKKLTIESSGVSVIREGAFSKIGPGLESLSLKGNILKNIDRKTFTDLRFLKSLDLSGNKLTELRRGYFESLRNLETLFLSNNQIAHIEDGVFEGLAAVKMLNLANNKLAKITKNMFKGLVNLEVLNLNGNEIAKFDEEALLSLKSLKVIDLGSNKLTKVKVFDLPNLERLFLNNNSFSTDGFMLGKLPSLSILNLDRNKISAITHQQFHPLGHSEHLISLSLAGNEIHDIECQVLENVPNLAVLSLQNNQITSLSCQPKGAMLVHSTFLPLQKLRRLYLSNNKIRLVDNGDLNVLPVLKEVSLDHNKINEIRDGSFDGLQLKKLFLNHNRLYYLPKGLFNGWNVKEITAVDLAENPWECVCNRDWVGDWLAEARTASTPSGSLGCLISPCSRGADPSQEPENHSFWITLIAGVLAIVALMFLVIAGYVYFQENCYPITTVSLGNLPSDMVRLIPSQESLLSFPNPIANHADILKPVPPPTISSISITIPSEMKQALNQDPVEEKQSGDKKRVRFDGI